MKHPRFSPHFLLKKLSGFLTQGTSPQSLALSTTIGLLLGIFPLLGVTTVTMTALSLRFPLNLPLMLGLSYLTCPIQVLMIIPFIRLGERVFGVPPVGLSPDALQAAFSSSFFGALQDLGAANLLGVAAWAMVAMPAGALIFKGLEIAFRFWLAKRGAV